MLFSVRHLVYCNDSIIVGENYDAGNGGCYGRHVVRITPPKEYIVIQVSIQDFDVSVDPLVG